MARPGLKIVCVMIAFVLFLLYVPALAETPAQFVRRVVADHKIVIFSKSYCPYCKRAKSVFNELNEKPYIIELDQQNDGADIQSAVADLVGRRTVPQVFIHSKHIGGSDDTVEAFQSGKLADLLGNDKRDPDL